MSEIDTNTTNVQDTSTKTVTFNTGNELANECLTKEANSSIAVSSAKTYESQLRKFSWYLDENDLSLFEAGIRDIKDLLREQVKQGLFGSTIDNLKSAIKKLYIYIRLEKNRDPKFDPLLLDEIGEFNTPSSLAQEPLSKEELELLFDAADSRRDRLMMLVGAETGARNEALRELMKSDFAPSDGLMEVQNTKTGGTYMVPISSELCLELDRWIAKERDVYSTVPSSDYLFPGKYSDKLTSNSRLREIINEAAEKAGIQEVVHRREPTDAERKFRNIDTDIKRYRVTPHTLRHTFSHLLDEAGLTTEQRRDALDHDSISTTEKHYTFTDSNYKERIPELLHSD